MERRCHAAQPSLFIKNPFLGVDLTLLSVEQRPQSTRHKPEYEVAILGSHLDTFNAVLGQTFGPPQGRIGWSLGSRAHMIRLYIHSYR